MKSHFSNLRCESCSFVFFFFFCPVFSTVPPAKTQGPSRTLRQEGCLCPLGSSQSCCCPMVRSPDRRTGCECSDVCCCCCCYCCRRRQTDAEEYSRLVCTEGLCSPDGGLPSWSPRTTWRTNAGCHGYCLSSQNECDASLLLVFLNVLRSVFLIS